MGSAVAAGVSIVPNPETGSEGPSNPRARNGLLATRWGPIDVVYREGHTDDGSTAVVSHDKVLTQVLGADAHGSDTSAGADALNPRLRGLATEPMADVSAFASTPCLLVRVAKATGEEYGTDHGFPRDGTTTAGESDAGAGFYVFQLGPQPVVLHFEGVCAGECDSGVCGPTQVERAGRWSTTQTRSASGREVIRSWGSCHGLVLFARIRPGQGRSGACAPYFMVQQECVLNPGEWVEVTRLWQTAPVPEAPTWLMLASGAGMLGRSARWARRHPSA